MKTRIIGDNVDINYDETLKFFEDRGSKKGLKHLYNHTMYQDNNPDLVLERDKAEKMRIVDLLRLSNKNAVLDIGCGVGRWGEEVLNHDAQYVGIDFSKNLLALAEENLSRFDFGKYDLINCSFQDLLKGMENSRIYPPFDRVIITGVLIYLNDNDVIQSLNALKTLLCKDCLIYIKETMALNVRLTLKDYYSDELKSEYDAVYRSEAEFRNILDTTLLNDGFKIVHQDYLYPHELNNRKETSQYFYILNK